MDISTLSLPELIDLRDRVSALIVTRKAEEKERTADEIATLLTQRGYSLDELFPGGKKGKKIGATKKVKYRHPDNPELTWSGAGRKPDWLKEWEASGKDLMKLIAR